VGLQPGGGGSGPDPEFSLSMKSICPLLAVASGLIFAPWLMFSFLAVVVCPVVAAFAYDAIQGDPRRAK
jgi:hypothetical protein